MTQGEANDLMVELFESLINEAKRNQGDAEIHTMVADSAHKLFITLSNAGAFANSTPIKNNGLIN